MHLVNSDTLHLGWNNPMQLCRLGASWGESCSAEKPSGNTSQQGTQAVLKANGILGCIR